MAEEPPEPGPTPAERRAAIHAGPVSPRWAAELAALQSEAYGASARPQGRPWRAPDLMRLCDEPSTFLAAINAPPEPRLEASTLGFGVCRTVLDEAELLILCRRPSSAGLGFGALLLQELIGAASRNGARSMFLEVSAGNHPALRLYEQYGFEHVGRRRGYYHDGSGLSEDALVLRKQLR